MLNKNEWIAVAVVLAVAIVFFGGGFLFNRGAFIQSGVQPTSNSMENQNVNGLAVKDIVVGTGQEIKPGDMITVEYTGTFADGTVFDSTAGRSPAQFQIGVGRVIAGWDQGLLGMKVGGQRTLVIPPQLGYGPNDYGPIPGNSTLYFDVKLVGIGQ